MMRCSVLQHLGAPDRWLPRRSSAAATGPSVREVIAHAVVMHRRPRGQALPGHSWQLPSLQAGRPVFPGGKRA